VGGGVPGPGWIFGKSYDAVAAVADRLALVLCALLAAVALVWAAVLYTWRWFAGHADRLLERALRWSREHPRLARYAGALIDPNRPGICVAAHPRRRAVRHRVGMGALLAVLWSRGGPLGLDHSVRDSMAALRNPLADRLMAAFDTLGDAVVLGPAAAAALMWLLLRRRWIAAAHWLAALAFGFALTGGLRAVLPGPRRGGIRRALARSHDGDDRVRLLRGADRARVAGARSRVAVPGRRRTGHASRLRGAVPRRALVERHRRRHVVRHRVGAGARHRVSAATSRGRSGCGRSALGFYGVFAIAAVWHAPRALEAKLARFAPEPPPRVLAVDAWWNGDWTRLPAQRNETDPGRSWALDVQYAGSAVALQQRLQADGWRVQRQADWIALLGLLDDDRPSSRQPVLPSTLDGRPEALLFVRPLGPNDAIALRLWVRTDADARWAPAVDRRHATLVLFASGEGVRHLAPGGE
jgi:hypothetical protein